MPTVLHVGRFHFFFFSNERQEPPHIHVEAKFWLNPVQLASNHGFRGYELSEIERLVRQHQTELLSAWNGYFSQQRP